MVDDDDLRFGDAKGDELAMNPGGLVGRLLELFTGALILLVMIYVIWTFFKTLYLVVGVGF